MFWEWKALGQEEDSLFGSLRFKDIVDILWCWLRGGVQVRDCEDEGGQVPCPGSSYLATHGILRRGPGPPLTFSPALMPSFLISAQGSSHAPGL